MKYFSYLLFLSSLNSFGQSPTEIYKGGMSEFYRFVGSNLKYPKEERQKGIEGRVLFKVRITNAAIDSLEIVNSVSPAIDDEARRVLLMTTGSWKIESDDFFLLSIIFLLDYPGRTSNQCLVGKTNKALKKNNFSEALVFCNEIRRRAPLDIENLNILASTYKKLNQTDESKKIEWSLVQIKNLKALKSEMN